MKKNPDLPSNSSILSRREFLQTSAVAASGPLLAGLATECAAQGGILAEYRSQFVRRGAATPVISAIQCPKDVPRYAKCEIAFKLDATYSNPFDADDVEVNGLFKLPDGRQVTVPAFFHVPYAPANNLTQLSGGGKYTKTGEAGWRIRFAGSELGPHELRIVARDSKGNATTSAPYTFTVTPSALPGFIRVSGTNPRYFEDSADGSLFFGCGANVAWTRVNERKDGITPSYEHYFGRAKGMMSSTRVWMCHWAWIEWMPRDENSMWRGYAGLGYYNQMMCSTFDRVFELAEKNGLRVMLTLEDNDEQMDKYPDGWRANPYNQVNGGVCGSPNEFFGSPEVRSWYKKRLRYILARWGYSRSLWALNGWNDCSNPNSDALGFLREMRDYVHQAVGEWRPILYGATFRGEANTICDYAQYGQGATELPKPCVEQECYAVDDPEWFRDSLRAELWDGLAKGLSAIMIWSHVRVDQTGSWDLFRDLLAFAADLPLNRKAWRPCMATIASTGPAADAKLTRLVAARPYGDVPGWATKAPRNTFTITTSENNQWIRGLCVALYGDRPGRALWRNPPTFLVDLPAPGRMILRVTEIGGGRATVVAKVDGVEVRRVSFENGRRELKADEQWVEIPLPAGQRSVFVDNAEPNGDWLHIPSYYLAYDVDNASSLVNLRGLSCGSEAFLYLRNMTFGHLYQQVLKAKPTVIENVAVEVAGLEDGAYDVLFFNPERGAEAGTATADSANGKLTFTIGNIKKDSAVKIRKR